MNNMLLSLLLTLFFLPFTFAQKDNSPVRLEFEARAEVFELIPCNETGLLVFYESIKQIDESNKAWVFVFYDKNLDPLWSKEVPVLKDLTYRDYHLENNILYLAFQNKGKSKSDKFNFQLLKIDLFDSRFTETSLFIPEKADLTNFDIVRDWFAVGFNYGKDDALLILRNLENENEQLVKFTDQSVFIEDVKIDSVNNKLFLALNIYQSRKQSALYLNVYNFDGTLDRSVEIAPPNKSEKLMNAQMFFSGANEIFILGSFNNLNGRSSVSEEDKEGGQSEGFYIAKLEKFEQKFIKFYSLIDFKNIKEILNNAELAKVNNMIKKNKKKDKESSLNYQFLIHHLIENDDDFILLAEAYYPEYHQVSTYSYDFYGRPVPYYYTIFDGYRYFNAFVAEIGRDGKMKWTNGMKIWDVMSMRLLKRVELFFDGDDIVLTYNKDGKIASKVISGYNEVGDEEQMKVETLYRNDVQLDTSNGMIKRWYGNTFIAFGYQTIRNSTLGGGSKRKVFYVNKLVFE